MRFIMIRRSDVMGNFAETFPPLGLPDVFLGVAILTFKLCIHYGDNDHIYNGLHGASQLQYMNGFIHPEQDRSYGFGASNLLE